ncbi:single-stranded DNA-binding protein [Microbulbifer sp. NBRC 101763]|uniref:single-stranded DNA-binding protein n=1 Tax=Microbulbifer TaxID=48073 RepID=UPI0003674695|nr:single-stranded DNA-binding protein [Microbulbifer variabilis]
MAHRRSRNKVFLMGRVTVDFESIVSRNTAIAFNVATTEIWTDRQSGSTQEKTETHRCIAYGNRAEYLIKYGCKGSLIDLEGKLQHRMRTDQHGKDHITAEIVIRDVQIIDDWKSESGYMNSTC